MAKQRLFPPPAQQSDDDKAGTRQNFENLATKLFTVPKSEIDKREKEWQAERRKRD